MTAVMKWRRAKAARPTEPARIHLYFPSDDLGKGAKAAFEAWRQPHPKRSKEPEPPRKAMTPCALCCGRSDADARRSRPSSSSRPDHARIATGRDRTCSRRRFSKGQAALLIRR
jgi:hypothetical protein